MLKICTWGEITKNYEHQNDLKLSVLHIKINHTKVENIIYFDVKMPNFPWFKRFRPFCFK